jgi:NAD(P)-dependent dehydrogenase (short-subunit alcohol dehydrogenase family)
MPHPPAIPSGSVEQIFPGSACLADLRDFLGALKSADTDALSDRQLLSLLQRGGLIPAPLLGRKAAVSGSARETYDASENGEPLLGLGDAIAEAMLLYGADTVLNSNSKTMDAARLSELRQSYGRRCAHVCADMSTEEGARSFVHKAGEFLGGLDTLVLNVGTHAEPSIDELSYADAKRIFDLNVAGAMFAVSEFVREFGSSVEKGRIILTTSINAKRSEVGHLLYDGSKGWLESFTRAVALDVANRGLDIRVNAVAPGLHKTPLTQKAIHSDPIAAKVIEAMIPLGIGDAASVVMPYVFLANPKNDYMSGASLDVSGGLGAAQMMPDRVVAVVKEILDGAATNSAD